MVAKKPPRKRGNRIAEKVHKIQGTGLRRPLFNDRRALPPPLSPDTKTTLPPPLSPDTKTIFLDLDETLIYSRKVPSPAGYDFVVKAPLRGRLGDVDVLVSKRPLVDEFLESLSKKKYEIVVFTAAPKAYASPILDKLDRKGLISHRLYRDSCRKVDGEELVKDLSGLGRDMKRVVIVDDNPTRYSLQPENAIPISSFSNDVDDWELKRLIEFFDACDGVEDMRVAVKDFLSKQDLSTLDIISTL
ncbi:PREDICTED: probable C-terminal domain small phosphatase [Ipomoea nil]|uniref:probable C-terminal domain small phosphatase n=1 Tax=Ipomoea nil TaxID=35883 RepID=UPI0009016C3F|nr:PREDICTED: probable C-terminal domain small phosphatase [Ipomoea nil]